MLQLRHPHTDREVSYVFLLAKPAQTIFTILTSSWRAATFALEDSETLSDATFSAFRFALLWFNLADFGIETTFHALQNLANLQNLASLPNALQSLLVQEPRRSTDTIFVFLWSAVLPFFQQLWISLRKDQERFQCI